MIYANTSTDTYTKHEFKWDDLAIETVTSSNRVFNASGQYQLTQFLYSDNGCISKDSVQVKVFSGYTPAYRPILFSASVASADSVEIKLKAESSASSLLLSRNTDFEKISGFTDAVYHDLTSLSQSEFVTYKIRAIDSCGRFSGSSNLVRTLFLEVDNVDNRMATFTWNIGIGANGELENYEIERQKDNGDWTSIYTTKTTGASLDFEALENEVINYRVKGQTKTDTFIIESYSNEVQIEAQTLLFVPNAFSPNGDGINDIFRIGNFGIQSFEGRVFSRWGQVIAYSTDINAIWDGIDINAQYYPPGSYTYHFSILTETGENHEITGNIYLLR